MKKQAEVVSKEYDRLLDEHGKLQVTTLCCVIMHDFHSLKNSFFVALWKGL